MSLKIPPLHVCRHLLEEISRASTKNINSDMYKFVSNKYRANQVSSERYCRAHKEASHDAATYWCLLRSTREHNELVMKYHGTGERTTEQAANLVGLKLPQEVIEGQKASDDETKT